MLFKPNTSPCARIVRPADAGYAAGVAPSNYGINAAAGLRLITVADPIDISDPFEIAYLLAPGGAIATPYTVNQGGQIFYLAADGVTPIDPTSLAAVDIAALSGFGAFSAWPVAISWAPGGYAAGPAGIMGATIPPVAFPHWFNLAL